MPVFTCPYCFQQIDLTGFSGDFFCPHCRGFVHDPQQRPPLRATLAMGSGAEFTTTAVMFYDAQKIAAAEALKAAAQANLQGFSTGLGFYGSLQYVVTRMVAVRLIEGYVSGKMTTHGMGQVQQYNDACLAMRDSGAFFPLNQIDGIRAAMPDMWRSIRRNEYGENVGAYTLYSDPCISILTEGGQVSVFWEKVEAYRVHE